MSQTDILTVIYPWNILIYAVFCILQNSFYHSFTILLQQVNVLMAIGIQLSTKETFFLFVAKHFDSFITRKSLPSCGKESLERER